MIVASAETTIEPMQPIRLEKRKNIEPRVLRGTHVCERGDGHCVPSVGATPDQIVGGRARFACVRLDAEPLEDVPVAFAGVDDLAMRLAEQIFAEGKRAFERGRLSIGAMIGGDATSALSVSGEMPKCVSPSTI